MDKLEKTNSEYKFKETSKISVADAKSNFSEYIARVAFANEKIIITKRGKPIAGLVSINDIKRLKNENETAGLKKIIGKWDNFEEIEPEIKKIFKKRSEEKPRDVSF
jgi:prevent-host-death family protein